MVSSFCYLGVHSSSVKIRYYVRVVNVKAVVILFEKKRHKDTENYINVLFKFTTSLFYEVVAVKAENDALKIIRTSHFLRVEVT